MTRRRVLLAAIACLILAGGAIAWATFSRPDPFRRIRLGMSRDEVLAVVGSAPVAETVSGPFEHTWLIWMMPERIVVVELTGVPPKVLEVSEGPGFDMSLIDRFGLSVRKLF